ncbi:MAG: DnaJ domain-containing protein [Pseudomonadota bacterium]
MSARKATATGTLQTTPVVNLLVYALDQRLDGTLVLEEGDGTKHAVYFAQGAPAKVRLGVPGLYLGEVLVGLGVLSEEVRQRTLAEALGSRRLHGEVLLEHGALDEATLRDGLREQVGKKVEYLAGLPPSTVYGYYDHVNYLERFGGSEIVRGRPLAILWRVVEKFADPERVIDLVERLGDRVLRLHPDAPILRFHFARGEQAVIEVLRAKPQPFSELRGRELVPDDRLNRLVYMLAITRQLDLGVPGMLPAGATEPPSSTRVASRPIPRVSGQQPAVGAPDPAPAPTPSPDERPVDPEVQAFKDEIRGKAERLEELSFYELLEVSTEATASEIQEAFLRLAKRWHPDRLGPEHADVRPLVTRIFARMTEAQQVLTDTIQRREYDLRDKRAQREAEEAEQVQRVLRAATAFQKAEILLRRNNLAGAEEEVRRAVADDPKQPEYRALLAWLEAQKPNADVNAAIAVLDQVLTELPNHLNARWYRGQLYKRVGRATRAVRDFRYIVEHDPRNVDAIREVRLYEMRQASGRGPSERPSDAPPHRSSRPPSQPRQGGTGGLLKRIFKKKGE